MSAFDRLQAVAEGLPITSNGVTLYPITMRNYREFVSCSPAWKLRLSTLPAKYMAMPFLRAVIEQEVDLRRAGQPVEGTVQAIIILLCLALHADIKQMDILLDNAGNFKALLFRDLNVTVTPADFDKIRRIVAEQNAIELPNEAENVELIEAEAAIEERGALHLKYDTDDLLASVAAHQRIRKQALYDYTVREFEELRRAIDRERNNLICSIGELAGLVKYPNGNPFPSWCFDREKSSRALLNEDAWLDSLGSAVKQTDHVPNLPKT